MALERTGLRFQYSPDSYSFIGTNEWAVVIAFGDKNPMQHGLKLYPKNWKESALVIYIYRAFARCSTRLIFLLYLAKGNFRLPGKCNPAMAGLRLILLPSTAKQNGQEWKITCLWVVTLPSPNFSFSCSQKEEGNCFLLELFSMSVDSRISGLQYFFFLARN